MEIIHFSDLHLWQIRHDFDLYPRRFLGLLNLVFSRMKKFPPEVGARVVERLVAADDADAMLFSGDLTTTSYSGEFTHGRELFEPVFEKYGEKFVSIPGNHDRFTPKVTRQRWFERDFLQSEQPDVHLQPLNDNVSALAIDGSYPQLLYACGRVSADQIARVTEILDAEQAAGRKVLVVFHYPVAYPAKQGGLTRNDIVHGLIDEARFREAIDRPPVLACLHGHCHSRWAIRLNHILSLNSGAAGRISSKPGDGPGFYQFRVENGAIENLRLWTLKAPEFKEWVEEPVDVEQLAMPSSP